MLDRGKLVILFIFGLSLAAALGGLWWRHLQTREVLEFWGADNAALISRAERVEALLLEPEVDGEADLAPADTAPRITVGGRVYRVAAVKDVSRGRGFLNMRGALTVKRNYHWQPSPCEAKWTHGLKFTGAKGVVTLVFSFDCPRVTAVGLGREAGTEPIADGLKLLLGEQFVEMSEKEKSGKAAE
jgi:hypothetical protein